MIQKRSRFEPAPFSPLFVPTPLGQYLKNYTFFKKNDENFLKNFWELFKLDLLFIYKKLASDDDAYLGWDWSKVWLFRTKELIFL